MTLNAPNTDIREWQEDEARWQRYLAEGHAVEHARVMEWLDELAGEDCIKTWD